MHECHRERRHFSGVKLCHFNPIFSPPSTEHNFGEGLKFNPFFGPIAPAKIGARTWWSSQG
jgi:hypothetical protein